MQERSHAFAMKSQIWMLDPRPNLPSIVKAVKNGFELSEASNTPVMLQLRIRACHVHGQFVAANNKHADFGLKDAMEQPERDINRIVLPPASFLHEKEKIEQRWPAAIKYIEENKLNEFFGEEGEFGLIVQGGGYNSAIRALEHLGLANVFGESKIPLYVMNVAYPLIDSELIRFCAGKRAVLVLEEGQPNFVEQNISAIFNQHECDTKLHGKDFLPLAGEYNTQTMQKGIRAFLEHYDYLDKEVQEAPDAGHVIKGHSLKIEDLSEDNVRAADVLPVGSLDENVHARPPGFCTGCPERPIFTAMKMVEQELGEHHVSADIGCHLFSILPPFNLGNTTMGYGLGGAGASALNAKNSNKRTISIMGDGGFWHNGLTSGIANAVFNKSDNLTIVIDNSYTAATGGQDILSSKAKNATRSTGHLIENATRGVGVKWVRTNERTYDLKTMKKNLRDALTTKTEGPKVIIAQSECMLNRQRRERGQMRQAIAAGQRVVRERFGVDPDTCTGDHSCIRLSGCPSLSIRPNPDSLRTDPVATVMNSCVGCGLCGEVSHAAVLCPSFYRAQIIFNPTKWDKFKEKIRRGVIGWIQRRNTAKRNKYAF